MNVAGSAVSVSFESIPPLGNGAQMGSAPTKCKTVQTGDLAVARGEQSKAHFSSASFHIQHIWLTKQQNFGRRIRSSGHIMLTDQTTNLQCLPAFGHQQLAIYVLLGFCWEIGAIQYLYTPVFFNNNKTQLRPTTNSSPPKTSLVSLATLITTSSSVPAN